MRLEATLIDVLKIREEHRRAQQADEDHDDEEGSVFSPVVFVIDGTEMATQSPSERLLHHSHCKARDTLKWFISIHPRGYINYVSDAYLGSIADNDITEVYGMLHTAVKSGDHVTASKGFLVADLLASMHCYLWVPPRRGGTRQSADDVRITSAIATKQIHIERAIRHVKAWHILRGSIRISQWGIISNVVRVCALLCNFYARPFRGHHAGAAAGAQTAGGVASPGPLDADDQEHDAVLLLSGDDVGAAMDALSETLAAKGYVYPSHA